MSDDNRPKAGTIGWRDLTVANAEEVRDFYSEVVGWSADSVDMGGYSDYSMLTTGGECVAGICHAQGTNADLPPMWLVYIVVEDVESSARKCETNGGKVLRPPTEPSQMGRFCVIEDPAGAVCALFEPARPEVAEA
jgi:predicted enzyme related to lactoylglutathione lyase